VYCIKICGRPNLKHPTCTKNVRTGHPSPPHTHTDCGRLLWTASYPFGLHVQKRIRFLESQLSSSQSDISKTFLNSFDWLENPAFQTGYFSLGHVKTG